MIALEPALRQARASGRKLLVPYVTGGIIPNWTDLLLAAQDAGADAVEIGLPFSDPTLDGPVIRRASDRALAAGVTPERLLEEVAGLRLSIPLAVMTYANLVFRPGARRFCSSLREAGIGGLIVPDVPVDEAGPLSEQAEAERIDLVLLASPSSPPSRRREVAERSRGFVYAVGVMGTTGEQAELSAAGSELVTSLQQFGRPAPDLPVLLGFGICDPAQAAEACRYADGVVVGSALVRRVLEGDGAERIGTFLARMRACMDGTGG